MDMTAYFLGKIASEGQGSGGGGSSVQSDYLQNDPNAADYIKNRPFYIETKKIQKTLEASEAPVNVSGALNLIEGNEYSYTFVDEEGTQKTFSVTAINLFELIGVNYIGFIDSDNETDLIVVDGAEIDSDGIFTDTNGFIYTCLYDFSFSGEGGEIKKIDKKFLPDDIATKLEIATPETLGGVMPKSVTGNPSATQDVFVDIETGRLYTFPGKEYYKASSDNLGLVKVKELISSSEGYLPTAMARDGTLYAKSPQVDSTVVPESTNAVSGAAVYSFIEELLAEGEY